MRRRLAASPITYNAVRDNYQWSDHVLRLLVTAGAIAWLKPASVADPACGDGSVVRAADRLLEESLVAHLGDISAPQVQALRERMPSRYTIHHGDALDTLVQAGKVDVVVLTEILEHIEDPDRLVRQAREQATYLVASSPLDEQEGVGNHEHVWAWNSLDYGIMLRDAGWTATAYSEIAFPYSGWPYTFQLWVCR